ncbi:MAG: hypothetical protein V3R37_05555 [Rhodospirillales bacterium]
MNPAFGVFFILAFLASGPSHATHSNDGECGNGHLGSSEDCSGSGSDGGTTTYAAPAPIVGSGIAGGILAAAVLGVGIGGIRRRRERHDPF